MNPSKEVNEFINAGCKFQDQGGIVIGDGTFIGHNTVLATLDHESGNGIGYWKQVPAVTVNRNQTMVAQSS